MVNIYSDPLNPPTMAALPLAAVLVKVYLFVVACTLGALLVLTFTMPQQATTNAWVHTIIVAVFAIVMPLRLGRAQAGKRCAIRAVGLIAAALFLVNVVEAIIPGFTPVWMRIDMAVTALIMVGVVLDVVRWAVTHKN